MASRGYSNRMRGVTRRPMRDVGGIKAPSFGINKKVTGLATTNRDEGTVGKGGVEVGGLPAGKSLARPGRKAFKDGGSVVDLDGRGASTKTHHASGKQMMGLSHSTPESPLPRPLPGGRGRPAVEAVMSDGADSDRGQYKDGGRAMYHNAESTLYQEHKKYGGAAVHKEHKDHDDDDDGEHAKSGGGKWISGAIKHPGALHRALHVPEGEKIPAKKLAKASHSDNPHMKQMVGLAKTLKGINH